MIAQKQPSGNRYIVQRYDGARDTLGARVGPSQVADFEGPMLLNIDNCHWVALCRRSV